MASNKFCIINVGTNGYANISRRLDKSLDAVGFEGGKIILSGQLPYGSPTHEQNPYAFKIYAFEHALRSGYKNILWIDSSFIPLYKLDALEQYINDYGFYFFKTGYNLAQSVNDTTLKYANITRDKAETITEYASGCVGLNFNQPLCVDVFNRWKEYMLAGMFKGSRLHDNQSQDPRFLFHRQDQSCLSLAMYEHRMEMNQDAPNWTAYYGDINMNGKLFLIHGI